MVERRLVTGRLLVASVVTGIAAATSAANAAYLTTYVTGDSGPSNKVFSVTMDPAVADSASVSIAVTHPTKTLDGIDFDLSAGAALGTVALGSPTSPGSVEKANVLTGSVGAAYVADATVIAPVPPPGAPAWVSTVLTTPFFSDYLYYVENQFGFAAGAPHRIIRHNVLTALEDRVYVGAEVNLEGLEIVDVAGTKRLFFFAQDPGDATKRALMAVDLAGGIATPGTAVVKIGGLFKAPASTDGSDELDYDSGSGLLFGTNIRNGEVIAFDPAANAVVGSPGALAGRFIDGTQVSAGAADGLGLLGRSVDGIRATGTGRLLFTGRGGVIGSIDIAGVLADGAQDADVLRMYDSVVAGSGYVFDDLTPLPEPSVGISFCIGALMLWAKRRSKPSDVRY